MKLKYNLQVNEVAGQFIAVALGEDSKKCKNIIFLNKVGSYILQLLFEEITRNDIITSVLAHYEGNPDVIRSETIEFLDKLKDLGLLSDEQKT